MSDPLPERELNQRWQRTLGATADWSMIDPQVTQKPVEVGGTLSHLATVGRTLSGGATLGGTLSGGHTLAGDAPGAAGTTTTGGYDLVGEVGRGGMGVVYRARQRSLAREIALKFIRPEQADQGARERFVSEALVNGLLDHPNIVPVHELGANEQGEVYIAMKLVGGRSWKALLHPQTPDERAAAAQYDLDKHLAVLQGVGNAIAFAHSRGIVHRDLKPENVMVGEFGEVLVMDWGIAVDIRDTPDGDQRAQHKSSVTAPSGTPSYMAPELAEGRGKDIGPWTDVYLLGAILHEILTGQPPHRGHSLMAVLLAAVRSEAPRYDATVPVGLGAIAAQAMRREPRERYASVADFQAAIAQYLKNRESERIAATARERLAEAEGMSDADAAARNRRYGTFAEAVAGFRQALVLWDGNAAARDGERTARIAYARAALTGGDLGLAEAQIEPLPAESGGDLRAEVAQARAAAQARERAARRNRWLLAGSTAAILAGLAIGMSLVNAERARTASERDRAEGSAREAREQRDAAEQERAAAERERVAADVARQQAQLRLVASLRQRSNDDTMRRSLLWDAAALRAAVGTDQERLQRQRVANALLTLPTPIGATTIPGGIEPSQYSANGAVVLLRTTGEWPSSTVRLWDLRRLEALTPDLASPLDRGNTVEWALSPDGTQLFRRDLAGWRPVSLANGELGDAQRDHPLPKPALVGDDAAMAMRLPGHEALLALAGTPRGSFFSTADDGRHLLGVAVDGTAFLWDLEEARLVGQVTTKEKAVNAAWSASGVAVVTVTGAVYVIDRATGAGKASHHVSATEHGSDAVHLVDLADRRLLLVVENGVTVQTTSVIELGLNVEDDRPVRILVAGLFLDGLRYALPLPNGFRATCAPETFESGGYGTYHLVALDFALPQAQTDEPLMAAMTAVAASGDGTRILAVAGGQVHRLDGAERTPLAAVLPAPEGLTGLSLSGDGTRYALAVGNTITLHRFDDGGLIARWTAPVEGAATIRLAADGSHLVAHGRSWSEVTWWQPDSGRSGTTRVWPGPLDPEALLTRDRTIARPWRTDDRPVQLAVTPETQQLQPGGVSPDGSALLTVSGFKVIPCVATVWDARTGEPRFAPIPYTFYANDAVFSPDGSRFAVVVMDRFARVYDARTGQPTTPPLPAAQCANGSAFFSRDGRVLVVSSADGSSESWWDVSTGDYIGGAYDTGSRLLASGVPCFLADGALLRANGTLRRQPETQGDVESALALASLLTGWRIDESEAAIRLLPTEYPAMFATYAPAKP